MDLGEVFDQYLRTTRSRVRVPVAVRRSSFRWTDVVPGFAMPGAGAGAWPGDADALHVTDAWQTLADGAPRRRRSAVDEDWYVTAKNVGAIGSGGPRHEVNLSQTGRHDSHGADGGGLGHGRALAHKDANYLGSVQGWSICSATS